MPSDKESMVPLDIASLSILQALVEAVNGLTRSVMMQALGPDQVLTVVVRDTPIRLYLPLAHTDLIQRFILQFRTLFEIDLLNAVRDSIPPGATVIDAGANIGTHSLFFALICGAAEVISFEPMRVSYEILQRNIALNEVNAIRAVNAALGTRPGSATLHFFSHWNTGAAMLDAGRDGPYRVTTIDELGLARLDFLKLDVEGAQLAVIAGAMQTIARCRPKIWVELRCAFGEVEPGHATLNKLGYRLAAQLSPDDWLFIPGAG